MKKIQVQKSGFNKYALLAGPFWYMHKGMVGTGMLMLVICLVTAGAGLIPVWIYCGMRGNCDFYHYLKKRNIYIRH